MALILLIHSNTTDGSTTFVDSSTNAHSISVAGDTHHETDQKKFGATSIYVDGVGDTLSCATTLAAFGSGDFTIDFWYYPKDKVGTYPCVMQNNLTSTYQANKWTFQDRHGVQNPNGYSIDVPNWGGNVLNSTSVTVQNAWIHLAFVRSGNTVYLFLDGILEDSAVISGSIDGGVAQGLHIGGQSNGKIKGYYDEIRALSGEAAWTSDFTPPTVEYSVPAVLLPIFNKKFIQNNTLLRR